jgi:chromosome segregation ATPase
MTDAIQKLFNFCSEAISKSLKLERENAELKAQNAELKAQNSAQAAQIAQLLVRNEGTAAYVTELQSCLAMQKRALEAQNQNVEARCQELVAQYEHIMTRMSQEMCQLQSRNEELSLETSDLLKNLQSLHDPGSWIRSSKQLEIVGILLSEINPIVERGELINEELAKLQSNIKDILTSTHASTERETVLQKLLDDEEKLLAEQRDLEGKIRQCEEVVGPLLFTFFQKVKDSMLASEMDGEE